MLRGRRRSGLKSSRAGRVVAIALALGLGSETSLAQTFDVPQALEEVRLPTIPLLDLREVAWARDHWRDFSGFLDEHFHMQLALSWTVIYQGATGIGSPNDTAVSSLDVFGRWRLWPSGPAGQGSLLFLYRDRSVYTGLTGDELSRAIGLPWNVNDSGSAAYSRFNQVYWLHEIPTWDLEISLLKVDQQAFFDRNRVAGNGNTQFLTQTLVHSQTIAFPGNGIGLNVQWRPTSWVHLSVGFGDANGNPNDPPSQSFASFFEGRYFSAYELIFRPPLPEPFGEGNYRLTGWNTAATDDQPGGDGFTLSFDQQLGSQFVAFLRWGRSPTATSVNEMDLSGGLVWTAPFGLPNNGAGFGFTWAKPSAPDTTDQYAMELYYRAELIEGFDLSPDIQFLFDPVDDPDSNFVAVFGIRSRFAF